ncbi:Cupredoxin [Ephemerocybe angulata]|uniref:Cupredoxin n=1 Tax=Ephemerocybe angulata TaxID=980116 RepID=A0A8H6MCW7_9AGAR|nr:Cupredoxin [Tulosesus angulatus]
MSASAPPLRRSNAQPLMQLTFEPSSVTAAEGDVIVFSFYPKNHTVTKSSFDKPCETSGDDEEDDSGFVSVASATTPTVWNWTVDSTDPAWFYCAQTAPLNHCQGGMVFAVNPTAENTFAAFQDRAKSGGSTSSTTTSGSTSGTQTSTSTSPAGSNTSTSGNNGGNGASSVAASAGAVLLAVAGGVAGFALL